MSEVWIEYCPECEKKTRHRYLDCEEHGKECDVVVCCECGMESVDGEEVVCQVK